MTTASLQSGNSPHPYVQATRDRVVIYDGGAGTTLQRAGLSVDRRVTWTYKHVHGYSKPYLRTRIQPVGLRFSVGQPVVERFKKLLATVFHNGIELHRIRT